MEQKPGKVKKAAALKYDIGSDSAPILAAVGVGAVAENILRVAQEHDVPVVQEATTADLLSKLSVGDSIPPVLYEAVAQILVFVSEIDSGAGRKYKL